MSQVLISDELLYQMANTIRNINGSSDLYTPQQMIAAVSRLKSGGTFTTYFVIGESPDTDALPSVMNGTKTVYVFTDSYLVSEITADMVSSSDAAINSVTRLNRNVMQVALDMNEGISSLRITLKPECFRFPPEDNVTVTVAVANVFDASIGTFDWMESKGPNVRTDTDTITWQTSRLWFRTQTPRSKTAGNYTETITNDTKSSWVIDADSLIKIDNEVFNVNQRDNSYYCIYVSEHEFDDVGLVQKVRWEGMAPYNNAEVNNVWELYAFADGGFMVYLEDMRGTLTGTYSLKGVTFNLQNGQYVSLYPTSTGYEVKYEKYNYTPKKRYYKDWPQSVTLDTLKDIPLEDMYVFYKGIYQDSGKFTLNTGDLFSFTEQVVFTFNGDSYISINSNNQDIRIDTVDAAITGLGYGIFEVSDLDNLKAFKVGWQGNAVYNSGKDDRNWEIIFFENGDAMIHYLTKGARGGTNSFYGTTFTTEDNTYISFYRQSGTTYTVEYEVYDISKHVTQDGE